MKFTRDHRLTRQADFRRVFSRPQVTRDDCFKVLRRGNDLPYCRLGLAVSRKACRTAVGRNRLKRLIRESFSAHQQQLASNGGLDIVVLPSPLAATICNSELRNLLRAHWKRIESPSPRSG